MSREITERLMRAHGVVAVLPASELGVKMRDVPVVGDYLIKLLVVRVIASVVQSRTARQLRAKIQCVANAASVGPNVPMERDIFR